jgi:hypothetical protein
MKGTPQRLKEPIQEYFLLDLLANSLIPFKQPENGLISDAAPL